MVPQFPAMSLFSSFLVKERILAICKKEDRPELKVELIVLWSTIIPL